MIMMDKQPKARKKNTHLKTNICYGPAAPGYKQQRIYSCCNRVRPLVPLHSLSQKIDFLGLSINGVSLTKNWWLSCNKHTNMIVWILGRYPVPMEMLPLFLCFDVLCGLFGSEIWYPLQSTLLALAQHISPENLAAEPGRGPSASSGPWFWAGEVGPWFFKIFKAGTGT